MGAPPTPLIPVFATGARPTRVCAGKRVPSVQDFGWLDSCDKHGNEEKAVRAASQSL
ncbi:integrase [Rhizobium sp. ZX09]|nr:integrase [Rhizobium sp. ZX09]